MAAQSAELNAGNDAAKAEAKKLGRRHGFQGRSGYLSAKDQKVALAEVAKATEIIAAASRAKAADTAQSPLMPPPKAANDAATKARTTAQQAEAAAQAGRPVLAAHTRCPTGHRPSTKRGYRCALTELLNAQQKPAKPPWPLRKPS